jgi:glucokinase
MTSGAADETFEFPILLGDVGGTNARFAVVRDAVSGMSAPEIVQTAAYATIDDAVRAAVLERLGVAPRSAVIAVAGPVDGDEIALTNCPWVVRPKGMFASVGLGDIVVLNDFEAQALAVLALGEDSLHRIGGGAPVPNAARVVLGPGTGLGVAGLVHSRGTWIPVPGEGGHMDIGPRSRRDFEIFPHLEPIEGRISGEQILCGRGLVNAYRAIARADGKTPRLTEPAAVTRAALVGTDEMAVEALAFFVTCLGRTAGDVALVFKSRGGVFLTGGIAQKIVPALETGSFRSAFEDKAPHSEMMGTIPVYVITDPVGALAGLAAYACFPEGFGVATEGRRWRRGQGSGGIQGEAG